MCFMTGKKKLKFRRNSNQNEALLCFSNVAKKNIIELYHHDCKKQSGALGKQFCNFKNLLNARNF